MNTPKSRLPEWNLECANIFSVTAIYLYNSGRPSTSYNIRILYRKQSDIQKSIIVNVMFGSPQYVYLYTLAAALAQFETVLWVLYCIRTYKYIYMNTCEFITLSQICVRQFVARYIDCTKSPFFILEGRKRRRFPWQ